MQQVIDLKILCKSYGKIESLGACIYFVILRVLDVGNI